jgi:hypothetical protein
MDRQKGSRKNGRRRSRNRNRGGGGKQPPVLSQFSDEASSYDTGIVTRSSVRGWPGGSICDLGKQVGFPDRLRITLKYTQDFQMVGSSNPAAQVFRMNSLFDPDKTGVGHQPSYFDALQSIYSRYCVMGAQARLSFKNVTTSVGADIVAMLSPEDVSSASVRDLAEARYSKLTATAPNNSGPVVARIMVPYMETRHILGTPDPLSDPDIRAVVTGNPNRQWLLIIRAEAADTVTIANVWCHAEIWFDSIFVDNDSLQPSTVVVKRKK